MDAVHYTKLKKREMELQASLTNLIATLDVSEEKKEEEVEESKINNLNKMQQNTLVEWQTSPSFSETALELIKLNIQVLGISFIFLVVSPYIF